MEREPVTVQTTIDTLYRLDFGEEDTIDEGVLQRIICKSEKMSSNEQILYNARGLQLLDVNNEDVEAAGGLDDVIEDLVKSGKEDVTLFLVQCQNPEIEARQKKSAIAVPAEVVTDLREDVMEVLARRATSAEAAEARIVIVHELVHALQDQALRLGEACTSTAWVTTFCMEHNWLLALYDQPAQDDVFGRQPYIIAPGTLSPGGRAEPVEGGYRLTGRWQWGTGVMHADWVMVAAKTDVDAEHGGVTNFLVKKGTPGFSAGPNMEKMGLRGSPTNALYFEDCEIPEEWRIGDEGTGFVQAMKALENGRLGMAAFGAGLAQACLNEALAYAKEREAFGKKIVQFQPVHFKLADMAIDADGARLLLLRAAWAHQQGTCSQALYSSAKLFATEAAVRCADRAVQIFGGAGYMSESRVERLFRDARLGPIGEGTSEIQRRLIADETIANFSK